MADDAGLKPAGVYPRVGSSPTQSTKKETKTNIMQDLTKLTISQALRYAAKLKNQVAEYRQRAVSSVSHQVDQPTAFDFDEVFGAVQQTSFDLSRVKAAIAETNAVTKITFKSLLFPVSSGERTISLTEAVAYLQEIKGLIAWIKTLPTQAAERITSTSRVFDFEADKYINKEVVTLCHLPEASRANTIEALQDEFDLVNGLVESKNQTTYLI